MKSLKSPFVVAALWSGRFSFRCRSLLATATLALLAGSFAQAQINVERHTQISPAENGLEAGHYPPREDYPLRLLAAGPHTSVAESNEDDNRYSRTGTVVRSDPSTLLLERTGLTGPMGEHLFFHLNVQAGQKPVLFKLSGGTGDADLFVNLGSQPDYFDFGAYDWASRTRKNPNGPEVGNNEEILLRHPAPGDYYVLVYGFTHFENASLVVTREESKAPPSIATPPESLTVDLGDPATFSVVATGGGALTYQWRKDTVPLPGGTDAVLHLAAVKATDAGDYDVVVSNLYGSSTSDPATLTVRSPSLPYGTPVAWLEAYGLAGGDPVAAELADVDGDGHPAWKEYVAGTIPTDPASVLRLTAGVGPDGRFVMDYPTTAGRVYAVEVSDDTRNWQTLVADVLGDGNAATFRDPQPAADREARFYRLTVLNRLALPEGMVWIPPGTFTMGSPDGERGRYSNEGPQTQVTISRGFWLGRYEVTQREYEAVMGTNPSYFKGDLDRPVEQVSWDDAVAYCEALTARERAAGRLPAGYEYGLPTEAQWEYACRAGTTTRYSWGDSDAESVMKQYCWYEKNARYVYWTLPHAAQEGTQPVGQKRPNGWGLYDMHGNVWEWCADWWGDSLPGGKVTDPTGPTTGSDRVNCGGSWYNPARYCRSAFRYRLNPSLSNSGLGFRVALVPVP